MSLRHIIGFLVCFLHSFKCDRTCSGTNNGFAVSSGIRQDQLLTSLRARYTNCTIVNGNLEITWLNKIPSPEVGTETCGNNTDTDLSFLNDITEITGYLSIVYNCIRVVPLRNLRMIRGDTSIACTQVACQYDHSVRIQFNSGLEYVYMPKLGEIKNYDVSISDNTKMCHLKTIMWADLFSDPSKQSATVDIKMNATNCEMCSHCPGKIKRCWGPSSLENVPTASCQKSLF